MVKNLYVLPNPIGSSLQTLLEVDVAVLSSVSSDNPRVFGKRGFKGLVVDSNKRGICAKSFFANPWGRAYKWGDTRTHVSPEENVAPFDRMYTWFAKLPTWNKDKFVIPVRSAAYDLLHQVSKRTGIGLTEISSLDEISGFESGGDETMIAYYTLGRKFPELVPVTA